MTKEMTVKEMILTNEMTVKEMKEKMIKEIIIITKEILAKGITIMAREVVIKQTLRQHLTLQDQVPHIRIWEVIMIVWSADRRTVCERSKWPNQSRSRN